MSEAVIIPFRDRGIDPLRQANLKRVVDQWTGFGIPMAVVDDGRTGDAQFNRSAAYNRGVAQFPNATMFVFAESDMLIEDDQVDEAIRKAHAAPGLVVPFTQYRYLTPDDSQRVRDYGVYPEECRPESIMEGGRSIGAINVVSRASLERIGQWDEAFEGNWYDDNAMIRAFEVCCGHTRWVKGPAHHLYHLPGWKGDHLTDADRAATDRNKARYLRYLNTASPDEIRELTAGR